MILLRDFLQNLALTSLNGTPVVGTGDFGINPIHLPKVISTINSAFDHFYGNFNLSTEQVIIALRDGISHYYLDSKYAYSNKARDYPKYIMDTDLFPFKDNVITIIDVSTIDGFNLITRDNMTAGGVLIPSYNCIHVPMDLGVDRLSVNYKANHEKIALTEPADSDFEINIPPALMNAFKAYCACLIIRNMGGVKLEESNGHYAVYMTEIENQINAGNISDGLGYINKRPLLGGWI